MAKRLSVKHRKAARDIQSALKKGTSPSKHKIAVQRSRAAKLRKACRMV